MTGINGMMLHNSTLDVPQFRNGAGWQTFASLNIANTWTLQNTFTNGIAVGDAAYTMALSAGKPIIVVMPDGGHAGWHCNPVASFTGPRNWESFHLNQLLPWIEANFRTYAEYDGRAVCGFSMGGFGALKYAAKYYGHFASVSSHSGPASLRRDFGLVVHWANLTSAVLDLAGGTVYGAPFWDQARVTADNPIERIESYRNKRIFLVAGISPDPINWFDSINETEVQIGRAHV